MIKLIITDCDGVLTTDEKWYTEDGKLIKRFSSKDATAIRFMERLYGVKTIMLSGDDRVNKKYCEMHRIEFFHAILNKRDMLLVIAAQEHIAYDEIAFIGDDLLDLEAGLHLQERGGLFLCPQDAALDVLKHASMIPVDGGHGVLARLYADRETLFKEKCK